MKKNTTKKTVKKTTKKTTKKTVTQANKNQINININSNNKGTGKSRSKANPRGETKQQPQIPSVIFNPSIVVPQPIYSQYPQYAPPRYISESVSASTSEPARTTTGLVSAGGAVDARATEASLAAEKAKDREEMMKIRKGALTGEELKKSLTIDEIFAEERRPKMSKLLEEVKDRLSTSGYGLTPSKSRIISKPIESTPAPPAITVSAGGSTAITTFRRVQDLTSDESKNGLLAEPPTSTVRPADPVIVGQRLIGPKDEDLNLPEAEAKLIVYRKPRGPNKTAEEKDSKKQLEEAKKFNERIARERKQLAAKDKKIEQRKIKEQQQSVIKANKNEERQIKSEIKMMNEEDKLSKKYEQLTSLPPASSQPSEKKGRGRPKKGGVKFRNEV